MALLPMATYTSMIDVLLWLRFPKRVLVDIFEHLRVQTRVRVRVLSTESLDERSWRVRAAAADYHPSL